MLSSRFWISRICDILVDGEEQLFDPKHPIWRIIAVLSVGLLAIGGVSSPDLLGGLV
jgi:hypothetical protein